MNLFDWLRQIGVLALIFFLRFGSPLANRERTGAILFGIKEMVGTISEE
jgi:hypothetical protein